MPAADPVAATPTRTARPAPVRTRDVLVLGTAEVAYCVTDALRQAGLSVGSWLAPADACHHRTREHIRRDLADPATLRSWSSAAVVISVWHGSARHSHPGEVVEPLVDAALERQAPHWLRLTRGVTDGGPQEAQAAVDHDPYRSTCYLPPGARAHLTRLRDQADPDGVYARTLTALLNVLPLTPGCSPRF
ncbi:hypothetical protein GCM10012287_03830 [Streptomyces daqingensis]|jgi:hypothetical protein|uniref:Uncharacterized protein n=1 Tax=Streptomyces daqingensis TaxID=1472640 RepID=A0ABQ2LSB3_9ACTN|nr:hypothetical protein [Streptomyces daqingensis]GGO42591.1 hypothetical protein GCM10012287_03830 [Streptomyces daqingensis]